METQKTISLREVVKDLGCPFLAATAATVAALMVPESVNHLYDAETHAQAAKLDARNGDADAAYEHLDQVDEQMDRGLEKALASLSLAAATAPAFAADTGINWFRRRRQKKKK